MPYAAALYHKLTPADGFVVAPDHFKKYDVMPVSIGTDPSLRLRPEEVRAITRYPERSLVPGAFEHNGSVMSLEDWFNPKRSRMTHPHRVQGLR